jgi:hypothetical protein
MQSTFVVHFITTKIKQMKNMIKQIIGTASLLLLLSADGFAQWQYAGAAAFSDAGVNFTSTAVDKNGTVYIAYQDQSTGTQQVTVKKFVSGAWTTVGTEKFSYGEADNISLAIDSASGTPYVAYSDAATNYGPTVMKFNGTSWDSVGHNGFSGMQAGYISLAVSNGTPYVAYEDNNSAAASVTVSMFNGSTWTVIDTVGFTGSNASLISLAINHSGHLYVGYKDASISNIGITVSTFNGSHWTVLGTAGFSVGAVGSVSLAVDNNDNLYAAYSDAGLVNSLGATVMKYNTGTSIWTSVGLPGFTTTEADYLSLKIGPTGTPYVAYSDFVNAGKASVMQYNGTAWVQTGAADFSNASAEYNSLVIDPTTGNPYVGYVDDGNSRGASVKKYSFSAGINDIDETTALTVNPNPNNGNFTLKVNTKDAGAMTLAIYDLVGQQVWSSGAIDINGSYFRSINAGDLAIGTYIIQVKTSSGVQTRKLEIVK